MRRQLIPFVVTLLAAFLCGASASRLHLLAALFAKPVLILAGTALLLFIVRRSSDMCGSLLFVWVARDFARVLLSRLLRRHLHGCVDLQLKIQETPRLRTLFQRPPPAIAR